MGDARWLFCPCCNRKVKVKVRADTVLLNFLLFCPWCKKQFLINLEYFEIKTVQEIDIEK